MDGFILWLKEYWYLLILLLAVTVVAFFVFRMAARSYKRYYSRYRQQEAQIKHLLDLKEKYSALTAEVIADAPNDELLEGAALSYQLRLQKQEDMTALFNTFSLPKKYVYTLDVFVQDGSARTFFKENGVELTLLIVPALNAIGENETAKKIDIIRRMYDPVNEDVSIDNDYINKIDEYINKAEVLTNIKLSAAKYIRENVADCIITD